MFRTIACVFSNSAVQLQVCFNKVELYSVLPEWCQRFCTIEYFHDSPEAMLCFARIKMETRHPVKGYIGSEFPAICSHCRVMAALSRKTLKFVRNFCVFFWKNDPVSSFKFCSESFYRDTDRRVVIKFREIWPTGNRWNRALFTWHTKQNFAWTAPESATASHRQRTQSAPESRRARRQNMTYVRRAIFLCLWR